MTHSAMFSHSPGLERLVLVTVVFFSGVPFRLLYVQPQQRAWAGFCGFVFLR
jgi:hypothetical protein